MRPRNIISLHSARVIPGSNYLIDANVWILALLQFSDMKSWENRYVDFFYEIVDSEHYRERYEQLIDDIASFSATLRFFDDRGIIADPALLLNKAIDEFDYNDYLYYAICRELKKTERVAIVTNDGDYHPPDLDVITSNPNLLNL